MKFLDKRSNKVKNAYSIEANSEKVLVKFTEKGKVYTYNPENIKIIDESQVDAANRIYRFEQRCYQCGQNATIHTYIVFSDNLDEDVTFPWDKERLSRNQDIFAHLQDSSIEYYGLKVIGGNPRLDEALLKKFPEKIKMKYSKTQKRSYPMNVCEHCGAKQGEYFIYRQVNDMIKNMREIEVIGEE